MPKLHSLQSLRALAALFVVLNHSLGVAAGHGLPQEPTTTAANFLGAQGVAIFFVISGFIMTYTADNPGDGEPAWGRARRFALRRVARVVPLYWFFTLIVALIGVSIGVSRLLDLTAGHLLRSLLFFPYLNANAVMLPVLPVGWSLNFEMFFYGLFALALLLPHRGRIWALLAVLGALVATGGVLYGSFSGALPKTLGEFLTEPILLLFGLGALMGWVRVRRPQIELPLSGPWLTLPLVALNLAGLLWQGRDPAPFRWTGLFWMVDGVIVALCVFGRPQSWAWLEGLGNASYSLYLVHILPLFLCFAVWKRTGYRMPLLFLAVSVLASALTALATYRWVEQPLHRLASRALLRRGRPAESAVAASVLQQV